MTKHQKCIHCDTTLKRMYVRLEGVFTGIDYYYCSACGSSFNIRDLVHYDEGKTKPVEQVIDEVFPDTTKIRDLPKETAAPTAWSTCPMCSYVIVTHQDATKCPTCGEPRG